MINKTDLVCGSIIAPLGLNYPPTSVLSNLEEMIYLVGDPETFRQQATEQSQTPEFISLAEEVATYLGNEMVSSVERIKEHVIPVLNTVVEQVTESFSMARVLEQTISGLTTQFGCVDSPFFDSPLYPTGRHSTGLSFAVYPLRKSFPDDMLKDVELTEELIAPFIVNHPDILPLFTDAVEDYREALRNAHDRRWWSRHFSTDGEVCDFTKVSSYRLNELFCVYVVLSKLRTSEQLLLPVQNISLEAYKLMINELWEGMNVFLPALRIMCNNYRRDGLVVLGKSKFALADATFSGVTFKTMHGECDILYSREYARHIDEADTSLAEVAYNYILHIIESGGRAKVSAHAFVSMDTNSFANTNPLRDLLNANVERCRTHITNLIRSHARVAVANKLASMGVHNPDLTNLTENVYVDGGYVEHLNVGHVDIGTVVMSSDIGVKLLKLLGYHNAADLLGHTRHELLNNVPRTKAIANAFVSFAVNYLTRENKALKD